MEKLGIPTVTITTSSYFERAKAASLENGGVEIPFVVVQHPIAGHDKAGVDAKVDAAMADILKAATAQ